MLYFIKCDFQVDENSGRQEGIAICSDPDTPIAIIDKNGKEVWRNENHPHDPAPDAKLLYQFSFWHHEGCSTFIFNDEWSKMHPEFL